MLSLPRQPHNEAFYFVISPFAHREERPRFHETVNAMSGGLLSRLTTYMGFGTATAGGSGGGAGASKSKSSSHPHSSRGGASSDNSSSKKKAGQDEDDTDDDYDDDDDDWTLVEPAAAALRGGDIVLGVEAVPGADADAEGAADILEPVDEDSDEEDSDEEEEDSEKGDDRSKQAAASLSDLDRDDVVRPAQFASRQAPSKSRYDMWLKHVNK